MATDMEKSRVTELHVRMDCNGCVQRIKKALNSIDGVYDVCVDLPQQKLKVVGRIDLETLVKAIKKTKKIATVCSYTEPAASEPEPPPPITEPEATSSPPATDATAQPPSETPPAEATHRPSPKKTLPLKNLSPRPKLRGPIRLNLKIWMKSTWCTATPVAISSENPGTTTPPIRQEIRHESPYYVTHSYNTNRPSPYVSEYAYIRSPPRDMTGEVKGIIRTAQVMETRLRLCSVTRIQIHARLYRLDLGIDKGK